MPQLEAEISKILEIKACRMLSEIQQILADDEIDDKDCFEKIEKIIGIFEKNGCDFGARHDF